MAPASFSHFVLSMINCFPPPGGQTMKLTIQQVPDPTPIQAWGLRIG
jgi:hypothetical protein